MIHFACINTYGIHLGRKAKDHPPENKILFQTLLVHSDSCAHS